MIKKIKILLVIISLATTLSLMSNTFSRYVAGTTGNLNMEFSNWQILVNTNDITSNSSSSINLVPVMEKNENIADNTIAPSSKGYFDIDIDPSNVNLSFDYAISLAINNLDVPDIIITKYAILDNNYVDGDPFETINLENNNILGTLQYDNNINDFKFEPFTIRVFFEWYEGENELMNDTQDSEVGYKAATEDTKLELTATINFTQKLS